MSIINYAKLAIAGDAGKFVGIGSNYEKKHLERIGSGLLMPAQELPKKVVDLTCAGYHWTVNQLCNPNVITVSLTTSAMVGGTFAFYPQFSKEKTTQLAGLAHEAGSNIIDFAAKYIKSDILWLAAYISVATCILGVGARTLGRFQNRRLMDPFNRQQQAINIVPQITQDVIPLKKTVI